MFLTEQRRHIEERLIGRYFPKFALHRDTAIGTMQTNRGAMYHMAVELIHFPLGPPQVKVVTPLNNRAGQRLGHRGPSSKMHHLGRDPHGALVLCLHPPSRWTPENTLYHSLLKARLWLEAWESYRKTGTPIDQFLRHGE